MHTWHSIRFSLLHFLARLLGYELAPQPQRRDGRGRFVSPAVEAAASRPAYPPDLTELATALLEHLGVSPRMYREAAPLTLPDDLDSLEGIQRTLRHWVLRNMERWIEGRGRSPGVVFSVLERTFALDRLQYAQQLSQAKAQAAAQPKVPKVYRDQWVGWYTPRSGQAAGNPVGATRASPEYRNDCATEVTAAGHRTGDVPSPPLVPSPGFAGDARVAPTAVPAAQRNNPAPQDPRPLTPAPIPVVAYRYDPTYDVVANLPKALRARRCEGNLHIGVGNDTQAALDDYYAKNQAELRGQWEEFGFEPRVIEEFDSHERRYFSACANFEKPLYLKQQADNGGAADCQSAYAAEGKSRVSTSITNEDEQAPSRQAVRCPALRGPPVETDGDVPSPPLCCALKTET